MRNLWFKLFGDGQGFVTVFWIIIVSQLLFWGGLVYVAIHFISKYW